MLPPNAVVDLFCGAGGLAHGFFLENFNIVAGIDNDNICKFPFEANNGQGQFVNKDMYELTSNELRTFFPDNHIKILVGCAPCQTFSSYARPNKNKDQKKWALLSEFSRLIREVSPDIISMENVHDIIFSDVYSSFIKTLIDCGYQVTANESVYAPDYGVPQTRTRLVLLASKYGKIELIPPTHRPEHYRTVGDVINDLPPISAGEKNELDNLHQASKLSPLNLERIRASVPGGTWRDWPDHLISECHKKEEGQSYKNVYGRMSYTEQAPTITTECYGFGNGRFGHPQQDRAISLREAALIQTFPLNYKFVPDKENYHIKDVARMIGNAVPVDLARAIAKSIKRFILSSDHFNQFYAT